MSNLPQTRPEVAVQLLGGLGNQMFQAAAGLALAERHDARLIFDIGRFRAKGLRAFALAPFGIEGEVRRQAPGPLDRLIAILHGRPRHQPRWWKGPFHQEQGFRHDPAFPALPASVMIAGYFQSPLYFAGIETRIAALFAPEKLASAHARQLAAELDGEDSVAIHLRRGDYASDPRAAAVHGVLGWDYYDRAVSRIRASVPGARLLVFSDSPAAAMEAANRWPGARPMAGESAGDDLFLMSRARHHILANSSFSWWSAWLDRRKGGLRIAPERWFAPGIGKDTADLFPEGWERL